MWQGQRKISVSSEDTEQPSTGMFVSKNDTHRCAGAIATSSEITTFSNGAEFDENTLPETQKETSMPVTSKTNTLAPLQSSNSSTDDEKTDAYSEKEPMKE